MYDFSKYKIRDYRHWSVYIYQNQSYLGRCVIWCRRQDALDLADVTAEEKEELFFVLEEMKRALKSVFQTDWFNYAFLGNETRHLHCHFIPRYASNREFDGIIFEDKKWGHNYKTDKSFIISEKLLGQIKQTIKGVLNNQGGQK